MSTMNAPSAASETGRGQLRRPDGSPVRVLVVDDEATLTELLSMALRYEGWDVRTATSGQQALGLARQFKPDVIVLDVMLPDLEGIEVCHQLRAAGTGTPVLFLTARDTSGDKLAGLAVGDDYVTKPFSIDELVARIRAVLRRTLPDGSDMDGRLRFADLVMDDETHEVWRANELIELTATEFNLLRYLLVNARRVVSKSEILSAVWDYDFEGDANIVETYISYLRKKIDRFDPPLVHTIRRVGYSLREPRS
jgi:two-component system OmpR family response regulator